VTEDHCDEGGFTVTRGADDTFVFLQLNGRRLEVAPRLPEWHRAPSASGDETDRSLDHPLATTTRRLAAAGITIAPRTLAPWGGTPF
jgi:hypothetical protein